MESFAQVARTVQYSDSSSKEANYSNSTVSSTTVLESISDLIPNTDFNPWYLAQLRKLGIKAFMEFANKARAGSETPAVLFKWMLLNPRLVK